MDMDHIEGKLQDIDINLDVIIEKASKKINKETLQNYIETLISRYYK